MSIKNKLGCLVDALISGEVDYIAHQANCFNTMGAGVAKEIARRIPGVREADNLTVKGDRGKLGGFSKTNNVYNLYGQYRYGRNQGRLTDYVALQSAFDSMLKDIALNNNGRSIRLGIPMLGCGLAGGDWTTVKEIILKCLSDNRDILEVDLTVYYL